MKKIIYLFLSVTSLLLITGCVDNYGYSYDSSYEYDEIEFREKMALSLDQEYADIDNLDRNIIQRIDLSIETLDYDKYRETLETALDSHDGSIENSDENHYGYLISSNFTLRVKTENLEAFLEEITEEGELMHLSRTTEDITISHSNAITQKEILEAKLARVLELISDATTSEIIELEQLTIQLQTELRQLNIALTSYDSLIEYTRVELYVREIEQFEENTLWEKTTNTFSKSIESVGVVAESLFLVMIALIPYAAIVGIITGTIVYIIYATKKSKK